MKRLTKAEAEKKYPGARFAGPVQIGSGVSIRSNVRIGSNVQIGSGVWIRSNVRIGSDVSIGSGVLVGYGVSIGSGVWVSSGTIIGRGTLSGAIISESAVVGALTTIATEAIIPVGVHIPSGLHNVAAALAINGIGEHKQLSAIACDKGLIIHVGCMNDYQGLPPGGAREEIAKKYSDDHPYFAAITLAERWYETIN